MDRFHDGHQVRLRSRMLDTYLHADDDVRGVSLHERRSCLNQAWTVHIYNGDGVYLLLHSGTFGRYLAATATRAPRGRRGFRAEQRDYDQPELRAIMWRAVRTGFEDDVMLRNVDGGYLRANGKYLPWNSGVSVEDCDTVSTMMHWTVEPIPLRAYPPDLPVPIQTPPRTILWPEPEVWRVIRHMPSEPDVPIYSRYCWSQFRFRGRSAFNLRNELARRMDFILEGRQSLDLVMCVRAGRHGRLTPLFVDLPRGELLLTLWIVVFMSGTPAYDALLHPDVSAQ